MKTAFEKRHDDFCSLMQHPLRVKDMCKFTQAEMDYAEEYIRANCHLSTGDYCQNINRLMIDDPRVRPQHRTRMWSCLLEAASLSVSKEKSV